VPEGHTNILRFPSGGACVECVDLDATAALAGRIADTLEPGDVVLLDGALAAGKTTFISLLARALGTKAQPSSPTYTISNVYEAPRFEIFHIDAYRLAGADDFHHLGLEEFFPGGVALIEWGDRVASAFPLALRIGIDFLGDSEEGRSFRLTSPNPRWRPLIAELAGEPARKSDSA